jgi:leucyl aminopeptidase
MEINLISGDITQQQGAIVVNLFEGVTSPAGATGAVDRALDGAISDLIASGEIKGRRGEMTLVHTLGKMTPSRVLVVGLGKQDGFDLNAVRSVSAEACRFLRGKGVKSASTIVHGAGIGGMEPAQAAQALAEGAILGTYRFETHKTTKSNNSEFALSIVESDAAKIEALNRGVSEAEIIAAAVNLCRDLANQPANHMTPTHLAEAALSVARDSGLTIEVLEKPQMAALGMGALLGVAQGSDEPPKFIVMRYNGDTGNAENRLGLLGKGITFDSGGLDIKSASGMSTMKGDMAGGASVIAAMGAIGRLKPKINVVGIVPATENMPSGKAQRPGDVVRAMNGKTIEIDNTDAEGRLVLADAASYARSIGLTRIVDVATLTGAISVALGGECMGAFGNDQTFTDQVIAAANGVGERAWQLPTFDEYKDQYKSDIADIKNTGDRGGGAITGALIIGEFTEGASWVHLDIAGTARTSSTKGFQVKGATGTPVRTLIALAQSLAG